MNPYASIIRAVCAAALALAAGTAAAAQQAPVTLVVPYAPGGATDILARIIAQRMSQELDRSFVVENRAGAGTLIGAQAVARAAPDGTMLLMATSTTLAINRSLYKTLPYKPGDFAPVGLVAEVPLVIVVAPSVKANSLAELVALAKAEPGALSFGSAGNGSPQHLAGELFKTSAGVSLTHVPYKGSAAALNDVLSGQVAMMFADLAPVLPQIKAGKVRALAVTSARRLPTLPDVPTVRETRVPGTADYEAVAWQSLVAAPGTPESITATYNAALSKVLADPAVKERFQSDGMSVRTSTPQELARFSETESERWAKVVKASGATID
ncbi:Bug family tripartite tricarboxylate transporter substrate binding protein [Bordetella genomosp. 13]|uniref:Bug family tripartite tricarboxylate transporter substrate binding protein n=1 Tax=Bordetella genomosp. 13 TaxID=463040 RepID=UPI0011A6329E|nr:tripartite tricarboxylate transporter substrate binding protein [Bordetella genomosp. 13]